jgi:hypothetical protein
MYRITVDFETSQEKAKAALAVIRNYVDRIFGKKVSGITMQEIEVEDEEDK